MTFDLFVISRKTAAEISMLTRSDSVLFFYFVPFNFQMLIFFSFRAQVLDFCTKNESTFVCIFDGTPLFLLLRKSFFFLPSSHATDEKNRKLRNRRHVLEKKTIARYGTQFYGNVHLCEILIQSAIFLSRCQTKEPRERRRVVDRRTIIKNGQFEKKSKEKKQQGHA